MNIETGNNKLFSRIGEFVFEQKCVPWRIYTQYCKLRNIIFNINTKEHWDSVWKTEQDTPNWYRFYPEAFSKICSLIETGTNVLDIGCGLGILLEKLKNEKKCAVQGIDISQTAIIKVKEKGLSGMVAKVPPIPLPSNTFDTVIATELLEHIANPVELVREMIRIIKPGGSIIVTVPNNALYPHTERDHVRVFNQDTLSMLFRKFESIKTVELFVAKEKDEKFTRIILRAKKCSSV